MSERVCYCGAELEATECYCVCHNPTSSCPSCKHCNGEYLRGLQDAEKTYKEKHKLELAKARLDELNHMVFIDGYGQKTYAPYVQFRSTIDGLFMSWEDRENMLKSNIAGLDKLNGLRGDSDEQM